MLLGSAVHSAKRGNDYVLGFAIQVSVRHLPQTNESIWQHAPAGDIRSMLSANVALG